VPAVFTVVVAVVAMVVPALFFHTKVAPVVVDEPVSVTLVLEQVSGPLLLALMLGKVVFCTSVVLAKEVH
jgi:hypothetical protein